MVMSEDTQMLTLNRLKTGVSKWRRTAAIKGAAAPFATPLKTLTSKEALLPVGMELERLIAPKINMQFSVLISHEL